MNTKRTLFGEILAAVKVGTLAYAALSMARTARAGTLEAYFSGLPEGCDPATISRRVTDQFLTTRPENYKPAGYFGNNGYGWNRIVQYSVVSLVEMTSKSDK